MKMSDTYETERLLKKMAEATRAGTTPTIPPEHGDNSLLLLAYFLAATASYDGTEEVSCSVLLTGQNHEKLSRLVAAAKMRLLRLRMGQPKTGRHQFTWLVNIDWLMDDDSMEAEDWFAMGEFLTAKLTMTRAPKCMARRSEETKLLLDIMGE